MAKLTRLLTALLCGAPLTILVPNKAEACSYIVPPPVRLFGPNAQVPSDLVYFKVLAADPGPLGLKLEDGTPIPASIRTIGQDRVFAPDSPVPVAQGPDFELVKVTLTYIYTDESGGGTSENYEFDVYERTQPITAPAPGLVLEETGLKDPVSSHKCATHPKA